MAARALRVGSALIAYPSDATAAEAQAINERLGGWRYSIPDYQYGQITRRIEDLLSAEESSE